MIIRDYRFGIQFIKEYYHKDNKGEKYHVEKLRRRQTRALPSQTNPRTIQHSQSKSASKRIPPHQRIHTLHTLHGHHQRKNKYSLRKTQRKMLNETLEIVKKRNRQRSISISYELLNKVKEQTRDCISVSGYIRMAILEKLEK